MIRVDSESGIRGMIPENARKEQHMKALVKRAKEFLVSEDGPTATEYAVMLALIIVVALGAISVLGTKVSTVFNNVKTSLTNQGGALG